MTKNKKQTLKFTYNYCNDRKDKRTDTYVGETKDGVFHGQGKYTRKEYEGKKYIGIFTNGKIFKGTRYFDGWGFKWEQTGTFKIFLDKESNRIEFKILGIGTLKQTLYFFNGMQCGKSDANEYDYEFYKGTFVDSTWHGKGELIEYSDKKFSKKISSYKGKFKSEEYSGDGEYTEYDKNNKWIRKWLGKFKNNEIIKGKYFEKKSDYYIGEFKNGKYHGKGTLTKKDGLKYKGTWENGELIQPHLKTK